MSMSFNFAIAGNSCSCFCMSRDRWTGSDSLEDLHVQDYHRSFNDMVVRKAIVTEKMMESAIRPTSHFGKAIENLSVAIKDKFSKNKEDNDDSTRDKTIEQARKNIFRTAFRGSPLPPKKTKKEKREHLLRLETSPMQTYKKEHNKGKLYK